MRDFYGTPPLFSSSLFDGTPKLFSSSLPARIRQNFQETQGQDPKSYSANKVLNKPEGDPKKGYEVLKSEYLARRASSPDFISRFPTLTTNLSNKDFVMLARNDMGNLVETEGFFNEISNAWKVARDTVAIGNIGTRAMLDDRDLYPYERRKIRQAREFQRAHMASDPGWFAAGAELAGTMLETAGSAFAVGRSLMISPATAPFAAVAAGIAAYNASFNLEGGNLYAELQMDGYTPSEAADIAVPYGMFIAGLDFAGLHLASKGFQGLRKGITTKVTSEFLKKRSKKDILKSVGRGYLTAVLGESGTEGLQEITTEQAKYRASYLYRPEKLYEPEYWEAFSHAFSHTFKGMVVLGGFGASARLAVEAKRYGEAKTHEREGKKHWDIKGRSKAPEVQDKVDREAGEDSLNSSVWIDAEVAKAALDEAEKQERKENGESTVKSEIDAKVEGFVDEVNQKAEEGGQVSILRADFDRLFGGTKLGDLILNHTSGSEDGMTKFEADAFEKVREERSKEASEADEEAIDAHVAFEEELAEIKVKLTEDIQAVLGQRARSGMSARSHAAMLLGVIRRNARVKGITPKEYYEKHFPALQAKVLGEGRPDPKSLFNFEQDADYDFVEADYRPEVVGWARELFGDRVAPNGKLASENFTRWFGDSKAVDAEGKPLVVYHGTDRDFTAFDPTKIGSRRDPGSLGGGFYFSTDPNIVRDRVSERGLPVYIQVRNPLRLSVADLGESKERVVREALGLPIEGTTVNAGEHARDVLEALLDQGFDSVVLDYTPSGYGHQEWMVPNPTQIKSTQNIGDFSADEGILLSQEGVAELFSALTQEIAGIKAKSMKASGWKDAIRGLVKSKDTEVKQDEVFWSGIEHWLDLQEGKITKEAVQEYLELGGVRIVPLTLGEQINLSSKYALPEVLAAARQAGGFAEDELLLTIANDGDAYSALTAKFPELIEDENWAETVVMDVFGTTKKDTQHGDYVLPGGRNYREVLLTLPRKETTPEDIDAKAREIAGNRGLDYDNIGDLGQERMRVFARAEINLDPSDTFRSPHWDQANVVAHIRMNERTDADGNRVLFIEEIQSDWGQKGKKQGFKRTVAPVTLKVIGQPMVVGKSSSIEYEVRDGGGNVVEEVTVYVDRDGQLGHPPMDSLGVDIPVDGQTVQDAENAIRERFAEDAFITGVPAAPFVSTTLKASLKVVKEQQDHTDPKTGKVTTRGVPVAYEVYYGTDEKGKPKLKETYKDEKPAKAEVQRLDALEKITEHTEGWLNLALKKILLMATNEGFDRVAFVDGQTSADRYDLSKAVDVIHAFQAKDGTWEIDAIKDGAVLDVQKGLSDTQIADHVGKDLAERIVAKKGEREDGAAGEEGYVYRGEDLKVGGEGMIKFYDEMLPQAAKKMVKKLGGKTTPASPLTKEDIEVSYVSELPSSDDFQQLLKDFEEAGIAVTHGGSFESKSRGERGSYFANLRVWGTREVVDPETLSPELKKKWHMIAATVPEDGNPLDYPGHWTARNKQTGRLIVRMEPNITEEIARDVTEDEARRQALQIASGHFKLENAFAIEVTPEMREAVAKGLPLFAREGQRKVLGQADFDSKNEAIVNILLDPDAKPTTLMHELMHWNLEEMTRMGSDIMTRVREQGYKPTFEEKQMLKDVEELLKWSGFKGTLAEWRAMKVKERKPFHEAIAVSFEKYLYEGKAPNKKLKGIFDRLLAWFRASFESIVKMDADYKAEFGRDLPGLNEDVRAIFGRMMSAERDVDAFRSMEEIEAMTVSREEYMEAGGQALTDEEKEQREAEWNEYNEALMDEIHAAKAELAIARLEEVGYQIRALERTGRKHNAETKKIIRDTRKEMELELRVLAVHQIQGYIHGNKYFRKDGTLVEDQESTGSRKLNRAQVEAISPEIAKVLSAAGLLSKAGVRVDGMADKFGYESGEQMVKALAEAKSLKDAVEEAVNKRILAEHTNLLDPIVMDEKIRSAVHNNIRRRIVALELKFLSPATNTRQEVRELKEAAKILIEEKPNGEVDLAAYNRNSARARKEARKALKDGDIEAARMAKRKELLNEFLFNEGKKAREETRKLINQIKQVFKAKSDKTTAKVRDITIANVLRGVLSKFGAGGERAAREYGDNLDTLLQDLASEHPGFYAEIIKKLESLKVLAAETAGPVPNNRRTKLEKISVRDVRSLRFFIKELWSASKKVKEIEIGELKSSLEEAAGLAVNALEENHPIKDVEEVGTKPSSRFWSEIVSYATSLVRFEHLFRRIDGFKDGIWSKMFRAIKGGGNKYRLALRAFIKKFEGMLKELNLELPGGARKVTAFGYTFGLGGGHTTKAEILHSAMHFFSNSSNRSRLVEGFRAKGLATNNPELANVTEEQIRQFFNRMIAEKILTEADFQFMNKVWETLNEEGMLGAAQNVFRKIKGFKYRTIEAEPSTVEIDGKTIKLSGGYIPVRYEEGTNSEKVEVSLKNLDADLVTKFFPQVESDFSKERTGSGGMLKLNLFGITEHASHVYRFIHMAEAVRNVGKVIAHPDVKRAFVARHGEEAYRRMEAWLKRSGTQESSERVDDPISKFMQFMSRSANMAIMFLNIPNAIQNYTGLIFPMRDIGVGDVLSASSKIMLTSPANRGEIYKMIASKSKEMAVRFEQQIFEIYGEVRETLIGASPLQKGQSFAKKWAYIAQTVTQNHVDAVIWMAAYNKTTREGMNNNLSDEDAEANAIVYADSMVARTQMAGNPEDIAHIETKVVLRSLFPFKSWFINWANNTWSQYHKDKMGKDRIERASEMFVSYIYLLAVPAFVAQAISMGLKGQLDDEDDDGWGDDILELIFRSQLQQLAGGLPGVAEAYRGFEGKYFDDSYFNGRMPTAPWVDAIDNAMSAPKKFWDNPGMKSSLSVLDAFGTVTGIPFRAFTDRAEVLLDVDEMEDTGTMDYLRALGTGRLSRAQRGR